MCPSTPALPSSCHWGWGAGMLNCLVLLRAVQYPGGKKRRDWSPGEKYDGSEVLLQPQHLVIRERQGEVTSFIGPIYSVGTTGLWAQAPSHRRMYVLPPG